jgi:RNA polymerase sigma factor (sigma-70 family)
MQHFFFFNVLVVKIAEKNNKMIANLELLEKCKKGDTRAQMEIYRLYYKTMYNTSLNIVGTAHEAEDIMQEAFLKAFDLLPKVELHAGFGGWLKKIVINKSLDVVRQRKVYFEEIDQAKPIISEDYQIEEQEETLSSKINRIKRAMDRLPDKYRAVLSLNLLEGYDHDEIGTILGITASTSRAQLSRGKRKLLELMN